MKNAVFTTLTIASILLPGSVLAQVASTMVLKDGSCPGGFTASGDSCKSEGSKIAIVRLGACPRGFTASGSYCIGDRGKFAVVRNGSCPSGTVSSGDYCVK